MNRLIPAILVLAAACGDNYPSKPPVVGELTLTTPEDTAVTRTLPITDDGESLTIVFGTPAHGTLTNSGPSVTYTPVANYHGMDSVSVMVSDGSHDVTATLSIVVTPVNDPPVANPDAFAGQENQTLVTATSALLANDTDIDGDQLTVTAVMATAGTVALAGGSVMFTPPTNFSGQATYTYTVSDGMAEATGTVTVTISSGNQPPVAVDDTATTMEDVPVDITSAMLLANDTDPEGQTLSVMSVGGATHGTVVLAANTATFTPEANYNGPATFSYVVTDGVATDTGLVTITVTAVNDAPVANDDVVMTNLDTPATIAATTLLANDTDVDGPALTITAVANAVNGTVVLAGTTITFTPTTNFVGAASFEYTVSDGTLTDVGAVTINVTTGNTAPVAVDDVATTAEDTAVVIAAADLATNDTDAEGDTLMVTAVGTPVNGTVVLAAGSITFTPAANFHGTASFEYTVSDGQGSDTGLVTITVTSVNDAPIAVDDTATTPVNTPAVIIASTLVANDTDADGDPLTVTAVGNPTHGTVVLAAGTITFTPDLAFAGAATFEYTVSDGTVSDTGLVTITVGTMNTPVVATDDTATTPLNTDLVVTTTTLLANDVDPDPDTLAITAVSNATNGTVMLGATDVTFTPTAGFAGTAGFDYTVSDGTATDVGHVTITVTAVCGDGVISATEQCEDTNVVGGDGCSATCQDESLVLFTFTGALGNELLGTAETVDPLLTSPVTITRGTGVSPAPAANTFSSTGWTTGTVLDVNDYVEITVGPTAGNTLKLLKLKFDLQRSNSGPDTWAVRSSLDSYAADIQTGMLATGGSLVSFSVTLGTAVASLTAPVTFRIYGYHASGGAGTWRQDNVSFVGVVGP